MILFVICQLVCVIDSWAHTSLVHSILSLKLGVTVGFASLVLKTRHRWFGGLCLRTIGGVFDRFGPQNQGVVDQRTRGGSRSLHRKVK